MAEHIKALGPRIDESQIKKFKQLLQDCNAKTGSELSLARLQDVIYRDFRRYVCDTDFSQATAIFGRNPPPGYVAGHYRAHEVQRLETLRQNSHLRMTKRLIQADYLGQHMLDFKRLETVNERYANAQFGLVQIVGSNRLAETQRLQALQQCLRERVMLAKKTRESDLIDLHNSVVDYMCFWLLFVYWLRPTTLLFLRNYFIDLNSGRAFLSQKDDDKFSHSTTINLTKSFVEQCQQLIELKRLIARSLDVYFEGEIVDLRLTETGPTAVRSRGELTDQKHSFDAKYLVDSPLLCHVMKQKNRIKLKPVSALDVLRALDFQDLVSNVGRHVGPSLCRNDSPEVGLSKGFYLDDITICIGTSHSSLTCSVFETNSNANIGLHQSRLREVAEKFEELLGFKAIELK